MPSTATTNRSLPGRKLAEHGVGELAVNLDVLLSGERVAVLVVDRPRVAENSAEDVGEEVGEELLLLERVGLGRREETRPAAEDLPHLRGSVG